ncbi:zinc-binding dehydrogenase, partial [Shigella flexneri]|nr:zinc-binding dehydrogenase [Shigella flexneri]
AAAAGATHLVNHKDTDLRATLKATIPPGTDVVVDPDGGDLAEPALRSLRWGGRFVTVGYASGDIPKIPLNLVLLKGIRILGFEYRGF